MSPEILYGVGTVTLLLVFFVVGWRNRHLSAAKKQAGDDAVRDSYRSNTPTRMEQGGDRAE
jgi:hypothetical protein